MSDSSGEFVKFVVAGLVGAGAHKALTDPQHQREVQQAHQDGILYEDRRLEPYFQQLLARLEVEKRESARLRAALQASESQRLLLRSELSSKELEIALLKAADTIVDKIYPKYLELTRPSLPQLPSAESPKANGTNEETQPPS